MTATRTGLLPFVSDGLADDQPAFVAVPAARIELLRAHLNGSGTTIRLTFHR